MICILAGEGKLPIEISRILKKKKIKHLIISLSKNKTIKSIKVSIGEIGKILRIVKKYNIKEVIFAGNVKRPNLKNTKFDLKGLYYLPKVITASKKGDGSLLNLATGIFKKNKINVITHHKYCPEISVSGSITKTTPKIKDLNDYRKGNNILLSLSKFDIGQSIIINNGFVISIEAAEGTAQMLLRSKKIYKIYNFNKHQGVLIKVPKKYQNLNSDLPTIGLKTIKDCISIGLNGIFLRKKYNIILDKEKCIKLANRNNFFISAI